MQRWLRGDFPAGDAQWERWLEVMGHPAWATDARYATREARQHNARRCGSYSASGVGSIPSTLSPAGDRRSGYRVSWSTLWKIYSKMSTWQRADFSPTSEHPVAGRLTYPGVPYTPAPTSLPLTARPAPLLGQHNDMFLEAMRGHCHTTRPDRRQGS